MRTLASLNDAVDDGRELPDAAPTDSSAVRWVFAATLAFWLAVFVVGRALF